MNMVKLTAAISKRDDWTMEEWQVHYKERHASLSASVRDFSRHSLRYLQNYALHPPEIPDFPDANSGRACVTELWFPTVEVLRTAYAEPDYMKYLRVDELRFCKFDDLAAGVGEEKSLLDFEPARGDKYYAHLARNKIFAFRTPRAGLERREFQRAWQTERAPQLMQSRHFVQCVRRYLQTHLLDVDVGIPGHVDHALIDEFWFTTIADAVTFWTAYRQSQVDAQSDARYLKSGSTWAIFAREHEVFGPPPN